MLVGSTTSAGKVSMFVKDAYLMWKNVFSGSNLIFGVQPTPAFDVSETAWGYRSLEKTIMDLRGIVPSRDLGVSLKGKITGDGMINYWAMFADGSGNTVETDKYKRYYAHIQFKPTANLQATLYVDYKDAANIVNSYTKSNVNNGAVTTALFVGYSEPFSYNIGVEGYLQTTANALKDTSAKSYSDLSGMGFSIFGSYYIIPELSLVARYDNYNPSTVDNSKDPAHFGQLRHYCRRYCFDSAITSLPVFHGNLTRMSLSCQTFCMRRMKHKRAAVRRMLPLPRASQFIIFSFNQ